jgi:hypothetical protein
MATRAAEIMARGAADPVVRLTAAAALGRMHNHQTEPVLTACTHDPDPGVRLAGLRGLATQGTVTARAAMIQCLSREHDTGVRAATTRLLHGGDVSAHDLRVSVQWRTGAVRCEPIVEPAGRQTPAGSF